MLPGSADVVIVGAGVFGTSVAFHLAEAGVGRVLLLDRGPVGGGTTPFAAGQTGYLQRDPAAQRFALYCMEFLESFEQRTGMPLDFRQVGSVRVALTPHHQDELQARHAAAAAAGEYTEFISAEAVQRRVPALRLPADALVLHIPRDGFTEPRSVAAGFAAAARERGVAIRTGVLVTSLLVENGAARGVATSDGTVAAPWVVLAAGAWARSLAAGVGVSLASVPVRHQALVTAPLPEIRPDQPIVRITEPQLYARPAEGGLLLGGYGYRPLSFDMRELALADVAALPADPIYYAQLRQAAVRYFPCLQEAIVTQERRGLPTIAPDGRLVVGEPAGVKGLVIASACTVGGIERSPGVGRLITELITGRPPFVPVEALRVDRFEDTYRSDAALRARCEDVYAHHYHAVY